MVHNDQTYYTKPVLHQRPYPNITLKPDLLRLKNEQMTINEKKLVDGQRVKLKNYHNLNPIETYDLLCFAPRSLFYERYDQTHAAKLLPKKIK